MSKSSDKAFLGHPVGLAILFFTEMWERFSYYGMRGLLTLYAASSIEKGGLGWTNAEAIALYGWYTMMVYVMGIPGGILADKVFGQKRMVLIGGLILCLGHGVLAIDSIWAFYAGLILIVLGVGGLKPNISTMVGGLYRQGDSRRDTGFTIFYMGINLGAFLAGIIVGAVGEKYGWHYGFGLAGIGMLFGQIIFSWGRKYLTEVGNLIKEEKPRDHVGEQTQYIKRLFTSPVSAIVTVLLSGFGLYIALTNATGVNYNSIGYGVLLLIFAPFIGIGINIYKDELSKIEKDRVAVLLISFLIVIVFWGAFEQAGGLMNIYTRSKIDRWTPRYVLEILFGIAALFFVYKGYIGRRKGSVYAQYWFGGAGVIAIVFAVLRIKVFTTANIEIPASVFQSVNAFFIITCGTVVALFWLRRSTKGKESSSIFKMAIGTIIMGLGFLAMAAASIQAASEPFGKGAMILLILAYFLHTIGELSSSPVSLSFITKLAPAKYASIMMGVYFACTGLGNKVAGAIGEASQVEPIKIELKAPRESFKNTIRIDTLLAKDKDISFKGQVYFNGNQLVLKNLEDNKQDLTPYFEFPIEKEKKGKKEVALPKEEQNYERLVASVKGENATATKPAHFTINLSKKDRVKDAKVPKADGKNYEGSILIEEVQNDRELKTFIYITIFTVAFGILLILFLKKLKALTHGVEEKEAEEARRIADEKEGV